jgi:hypothetical protein
MDDSASLRAHHEPRWIAISSNRATASERDHPRGCATVADMRLLAALVALVWSSACRAPQPAPIEQQSVTPTSVIASAPPDTAGALPDTAGALPDTARARRTGAVLFCMYGGQGVVPANAKPGDYYRVVLLLEVTTPEGSPTEALPLTSLVLEDAGGKPLARMRAAISAERVPRIARPGAWQSALTDHGPAFDDRYASGVTRVRVEAWLDTKPATPPARVRVVLAGAGAPAELSGAVAGEWPTA